MKRRWMAVVPLIALLFTFPGYAQNTDTTDSTSPQSGEQVEQTPTQDETPQQPAPESGEEQVDGPSEESAPQPRQPRDIMFGQMMAVQAQLGIHRGNKGKDKHARVRAQVDALVEEAAGTLGENASSAEIRAFVQARSAGYESVDEMHEDVTAVLGENANPGQVKAYLMLRRAELHGLAEREADMDALKAEIQSHGKLTTGTLRRLLKDRRHPGKRGKVEMSADVRTREKHEDRAEDEEADIEHRANTNLEADVETRHEGIEEHLAETQNRVESRRRASENHRAEIKADVEARHEDIEEHLAETRNRVASRRGGLNVRAEARASGRGAGRVEILREKHNTEPGDREDDE